ncbi:MAG: cadherin-like beta sandwich domain-containing protein, partial [Bacteroidota bacterium]|nr:cadherin-like beta sandwich domain-containing protein [Bacteroidota bacterium]
VAPQSIVANQALVSFTFDDNFVRQTSILDSKGVKGTIACAVVWIEPYDISRLQSLQNNGWEIASHSVNHPDVLHSSESEYINSKNYFISNGLNVVGFVTPGGGANATMDQWAQKYYTWTRDVVTYPAGFPYYFWLCNNLPITKYHLKGTETAGHSLAELKKIVDYADQNHCWIIWMIHDGDMKDSDLSALIDYIKAKNIQILPVGSALKIYDSTNANVDLSALTISSGSLSPTFASDTLTYTDSVDNSVSSVTVTPTAEDSTATITVNGVAVTSGQASQSINLNVGANTINVAVTSQDGATKTYTVTVTREAATSSNANLSALTMTVTPTAEDSIATITVNGVAVTSGQASQSINLSVGTNTIKIVVTAQNGAMKTYTISVTR